MPHRIGQVPRKMNPASHPDLLATVCPFGVEHPASHPEGVATTLRNLEMSFIMEFAENLILRMMEDPVERDRKFREHTYHMKERCAKTKEMWSYPVRPYGFWTFDRHNALISLRRCTESVEGIKCSRCLECTHNSVEGETIKVVNNEIAKNTRLLSCLNPVLIYSGQKTTGYTRTPYQHHNHEKEST